MLDIREYLWKKPVILIFTEPGVLVNMKLHNKLIKQGYAVIENAEHYRQLLRDSKSGYVLINLDGTVKCIGSINSLNDLL